MARAKGEDVDDEEDEEEVSEEEELVPVKAGRRQRNAAEPAAADDTSKTESTLGKRKPQKEQKGDQKGEMDAKKHAALEKVRAAAVANEVNFTAADEAKVESPISKHSKGRTRKLAGGTQCAEISAGGGALIKVGSNVTLTLTEQNARGKKVGDATTVNFVVGLKQVPSALDRACVGMRSGGRSLVSMGAGGNDKPLPPFPLGQPLSLEIMVDKVG